MKSWTIVTIDGIIYEIEFAKHSFSDQYCVFYDYDNKVLHYLFLRHILLITSKSELIKKI